MPKYRHQADPFVEDASREEPTRTRRELFEYSNDVPESARTMKGQISNVKGQFVSLLLTEASSSSMAITRHLLPQGQSRRCPFINGAHGSGYVIGLGPRSLDDWSTNSNAHPETADQPGGRVLGSDTRFMLVNRPFEYLNVTALNHPDEPEACSQMVRRQPVS
jgi:hypothetical protein